MKRNKIEKRIIEAADKLTPEPPSFSSVTAGVDWDNVLAQGERPKKRNLRLLIPAIAGASAAAVAAIVIPLVLFFTNKTVYFGAGEPRPIIYGDFSVDRWNCTNSEMDFSLSTLKVVEERIETPSSALLFGKEGEYVCCVLFNGSPFDSFDIGDLTLSMGEYRGKAAYQGRDFGFSVCFPTKTLSNNTIIVSFTEFSSGEGGSVYYVPIN